MVFGLANKENRMNLSVEYLGKRFENPFVLASAPPAANADMIARAFEAGWAGAVVKTLICEPFKNLKNRFASSRLTRREQGWPDCPAGGQGNAITGFENLELLSERTPEEWFRDIRRLKKDFPGKIMIGSIMGDAKDKGQWMELALGCQDAGADMIELNFSCPHGYPEKGKGMAIGQSAEFSARITGWLKNAKEIHVPIVPKLTAAVPDISFIGEAVRDAGADGLSAINTFPSIMGFDLRTLQPKPSVGGRTTAGGYSGPGLKPIALRCVGDLVKNPGLPVMASGGVSSGFDAAEFILIGAPIIQVCTAVMLEGYAIIARLNRELKEFMGWHGFSSIGDFMGAGQKMIRPFSDLNTDYSVKARIDSGRCTGCGACFVSCRDAAYQAIEMKNKVAVVAAGKCTGCSLCFQVCPAGAVSMAEE